MRVKPKLDYHLTGTSITLDSSKVYEAIHATNQPDWEEKEKIFVDGVLLEKGEYSIIK